MTNVWGDAIGAAIIEYRCRESLGKTSNAMLLTNPQTDAPAENTDVVADGKADAVVVEEA